MAAKERLEQSIEALLADPAHAGHPLRLALAELFEQYRGTLHQIERIAHISDRYQDVTRRESLSLSERYNKQLRQMQRAARISDRYQLMMRDMHEVLKEVSSKDALTGIANRRLLMERLKLECTRADRLGHPLTLALADVDRFKAINDTHGHDVGDKVLVDIAQLIAAGVRGYDLCGRWGGEEFLMIFPETPASEGALLIGRIRQTLGNIQVGEGADLIKVSASFGLAERRPGETITEAVKRADRALFAAKHAGRNRCEVAP
jgi:diguanylate cyclase